MLGVGRSKSLGVKRGIVNNIMQTVESIKHAIEIVNNTFGIKVDAVCTGIAGQHIRSLQHSDYITRDNPEAFIDDKDIKKLHEKFNFNIAQPDGSMKKLTDVSKLHALGWKHQISIEKGVEKMYSWYLG